VLITDTAENLGRIVRPGDRDWDSARGTFNLLIDQRPEAIAFPADEREVAAVIAYARRRGLRLAAQATGHNPGPLGSLEGTLILNTSALTGVSIDAGARRVRVGAATKWEKVTPRLSELGLAGLHGSSPDVGIVGYSLGGGIGWLARKHGMQTNP
jgi:FAD/FMN-containing dehydrogenase